MNNNFLTYKTSGAKCLTKCPYKPDKLIGSGLCCCCDFFVDSPLCEKIVECSFSFEMDKLQAASILPYSFNEKKCPAGKCRGNTLVEIHSIACCECNYFQGKIKGKKQIACSHPDLIKADE